MSAPPPTVPAVLLPELLGFIPQFLLDDIINTANDEARQSIDAMEQFLQRWADARAEKAPDWDPTQEIEQGLVAFQTLLEHHLDVAFDFFEAWSMRNIFAVPADLPVITPHHAGLNLEHPPEREAEVLAEIDELRRKIHAQRKLKRLFTRAVHKSSKNLAVSRTRLDRLAFLRSTHMQTLLALPAELEAMYAGVTSLPTLDSSATALDLSSAVVPGKRGWETSRTGYENWAVEQLMERAKESARGETGEGGNEFGEGRAEVAAAVGRVAEVGRVEDLKVVLEKVTGAQAGNSKGKGVDRMNTGPD